MLEKLVVVRLIDGRLYKGLTSDFSPGEESFTVKVTSGPWKGERVTVALSSLKAVFFVKTLDGNKKYQERKLMMPESLPGQKVLVTFKDGETLRGTATGLHLTLSGFFLFPSDPQSNNKRIFISRTALKSVREEKPEKAGEGR